MRCILLVVAGVVFGSMGVAGCKGTPSCEEAINQASKRVPELADPKEMSQAVAQCIKDQWPAEVRTCVAEARDQPDLVACMMRHEPRTWKMFSESKTDITKIKAKKYAFEAYPQWAISHPDKVCPDNLADLNEYMSEADTNDSWGRPFRMMCGAVLPPGAKGLAVMSAGEDGKEGTADDIKSWE